MSDPFNRKEQRDPLDITNQSSVQIQDKTTAIQISRLEQNINQLQEAIAALQNKKTEEPEAPQRVQPVQQVKVEKTQPVQEAKWKRYVGE